MFDRRLALDQLTNLEIACERILERVQVIAEPKDFLISDAGLMVLDSVAMPLIGLGEELKALEKHAPRDLFADYPEVDWKGLKGMRDRLSHGYFFIDNEAVFYTSKEEIPDVLAAVRAIRARVEAIDGPA